MNIDNRFTELREYGERLLTAIEERSLDNALLYSQLWSDRIQGLFSCISSDEISSYSVEIENLVIQNQAIKDHISTLHAKTLTQLKETKNSRTAMVHYHHVR